MDATEIEETKGQANVANDIVVWSLGLVSSVIRWDWFVLYFVLIVVGSNLVSIVLRLLCLVHYTWV